MTITLFIAHNILFLYADQLAKYEEIKKLAAQRTGREIEEFERIATCSFIVKKRVFFEPRRTNELSNEVERKLLCHQVYNRVLVFLHNFIS
jgi:hypothetical protein